jgi:hypothetical protein
VSGIKTKREAASELKQICQVGTRFTKPAPR